MLIIGQMFAFDEVPFLTHSFVMKPSAHDYDIWPHRFVMRCDMYFDILNMRPMA